MSFAVVTCRDASLMGKPPLGPQQLAIDDLPVGCLQPWRSRLFKRRLGLHGGRNHGSGAPSCATLYVAVAQQALGESGQAVSDERPEAL
jgi:hypothetical protein